MAESAAKDNVENPPASTGINKKIAIAFIVMAVWSAVLVWVYYAGKL